MLLRIDIRFEYYVYVIVFFASVFVKFICVISSRTIRMKSVLNLLVIIMNYQGVVRDKIVNGGRCLILIGLGVLRNRFVCCFLPEVLVCASVVYKSAVSR